MSDLAIWPKKNLNHDLTLGYMRTVLTVFSMLSYLNNITNGARFGYSLFCI